MEPLTPLAKTSITVSWIMVALACVSTSAQLIWLLRINKTIPGVADICVLLAFVIGILLVAQTTWAMVDEGSAKHQWDISQQNIAAVAKVRGRQGPFAWSGLISVKVSHYQRGSMVDLRRSRTCFGLLSLACRPSVRYT